MNIVISDTTALIVFAKADQLRLLSNLFEKVFIPQAVKDELYFKDDIVRYRIERFEQIVVRPVTNKIPDFKLDIGETEAITLALELDLPLIIDERKGRKIAQSQGVKVVGILGILIENYRQNCISAEECRYCFSLFKQNGLRISKALEELFFAKLSEIM